MIKEILPIQTKWELILMVLLAPFRRRSAMKTKKDGACGGVSKACLRCSIGWEQNHEVDLDG